jgi:hypothetical protein
MKRTFGVLTLTTILIISTVSALKEFRNHARLENRKLCNELAEGILKETGHAFPVGFDSNTIVVWGTVNSAEDQNQIAGLVSSKIAEFRNEIFPVGSHAKFLNLIGIAGQPAPQNPDRIGLPLENTEPNWHASSKGSRI